MFFSEPGGYIQIPDRQRQMPCKMFEALRGDSGAGLVDAVLEQWVGDSRKLRSRVPVAFGTVHLSALAME